MESQPPCSQNEAEKRAAALLIDVRECVLAAPRAGSESQQAM